MRLIWTCNKFTLARLMINQRSLTLFRIQRKDRIQIDVRVMIFVLNHIIRVQFIKDLLVASNLEKVSKIWNKHKRFEFIINLSTQINLKHINMLTLINLKTELFPCFKHHRTLTIEQCPNLQKLSKNETKILHVNSLRTFWKQWCNIIIQLLLVILQNIHLSHFNLHKQDEETRRERMLTLKPHLLFPLQLCLMVFLEWLIWRMMKDI